MPPVYLIHWGNPSIEHNEISDIEQWWEHADTKFNYKVLAETSPAHHTVREALRIAIEDNESQIVYFTCHGSRDGFSFSSKGQSHVPYSLFAQWIAGMNGTNDKRLVLGSCEAMSPDVHIEHFMPSWVTHVGGFQDCPTGSNVADLAASVVVNLYKWGLYVGEAHSKALLATLGQGLEAQMAAGKLAFEAADKEFQDDPLRFVPGSMRSSVVMAGRHPVTGVWERIQSS